MDLDTLLAREAVRETLARYNLAGDRGQTDELAACFTPTGVLEIEGGWTATGRDEIAERTGGVARTTSSLSSSESKSTSTKHRMRHHLTTQGIELSAPDRARAYSYFIVVTESGPDHAGRYVDRLERVEGRWLLSHRRVVVEWWSPSSRYTQS